jgi:hypothetical protein
MRTFLLVLFICAFALSAPPESEVWKIDNLERIGGNKVTMLGHPHVITTKYGKAVAFNGIDDALYLDVHPLAGADAFTLEVIFRPDAGGQEEQRFFHLQETGTQTRMLMELRLTNDRWFLDSFALSGNESKTLMDRGKVHPAGQWYDVAAVYDGHEFRNYVNGVLQGKAEVHLMPQGAGRTSMGTRIDKRSFFKGAIMEARFTRHALQPDQFLKAPGL